jgi:hypothetical protein
MYATTSYNTRLALRLPSVGYGVRKTPIGRALCAGTPFVVFYSPTFLLSCKTFSFAYSGSKNVANLIRYAKCPLKK